MHRPVHVLAEQFAAELTLDLSHQLEPALPFQTGSLNVHIDVLVGPTGGIGEEDDVGFEALCLVQVHDPHDVSAARLERQRFHLVQRLGVGFQRIRRIGETAALLHDLTDTVDRVQNIPRVHAPRRVAASAR